MIRAFVLALLPLAAAVPSAAYAQTAPADAGYTVEETPLGTLVEDPAARAVLDKYIPGLSTSEHMPMIKDMSLKTLQSHAPDRVTDKVLADVQTDLNKLPVNK